MTENLKQVALPIDHFRRVAKKEYADWQEALIREFAQNSVDAGATEVRFNYDEATKILTVVDNGHGMDLETCENVLLTMGGTHKNSDDAVGGFGIAKQILYFAWPDWEILSQDYRISGKGCYYSVHKTDKYVQGVTSVIRIDEESEFSLVRPRYYLGSCQTDCKFYWNGSQVNPVYLPGNEIRDLGWGKLRKYENKVASESSYIYVRANGVTMFDHYVGSGLKSIVSIDLTGDSRSILTSNRDGLNSPYREEFAQLIQDINVNKRSALIPKDHIKLSIFPGYGNIRVGDVAVEAAETAKTLTVDALRSNKSPSLPVTSMIVEVNGSAVMDRPDVLVQTINQEIPKEFNPDSWSYFARNLLALWNLVLSQVLMDSGAKCTFGIGFTLDKDVEAAILRRDGEPPVFLLNPEKLDKEANLSNKWYLIQDLKSKAVHEIAHLATPGEGHNENFVLTMHLLEKNTWKSEKVYKKLAKLRKITFKTEV